jgi:hypothetical protein
MKRDMDIVRELLLRIEAVNMPAGHPALLTVTSDDLVRPGDDQNSIAEHVRLLVDAGFVKPTRLSGPEFFGVSGLTWRGHDFLDAIRDPEIWRQTKDGATKAGGFTVEILGDLAKGLLKTQIKKYTGIDL